MFLVSGITGHVGGAAALRLLESGEQVRALVRDPGKAADWAGRGVDLMAGDLTDHDALTHALRDVEGAFLMQPTPFAVSPGLPEARAINAGIVEGLRRAPPPRLVILSSVGSERTSGLGNITQTHLLEQALGDLAFPLATVRAGAFLENNLHALEAARESGVFESWLQPVERPFPMIATRDIGAQVASLLIEGWEGRLLLELGSRYSPDDLASAMTEVLGRDVQARPIPREQWIERLQRMGMPVDKASMWAEMQDGFNAGHIDFGVPDALRVAGSTTPAELFAGARLG